VLVAPPAEELVFRGVLYAGLARSWRPAIAGVVTTTIFVALHLTEVGGYWPGWLAIGAMGALALRVRLREGSLWPAIALHATYNAGLVLLVYAR
jgi:membrane protease YdiL (CAAX protease family)